MLLRTNNFLAVALVLLLPNTAWGLVERPAVEDVQTEEAIVRHAQRSQELLLQQEVSRQRNLGRRLEMAKALAGIRRPVVPGAQATPGVAVAALARTSASPTAAASPRSVRAEQAWEGQVLALGVIALALLAIGILYRIRKESVLSHERKRLQQERLKRQLARLP